MPLPFASAALRTQLYIPLLEFRPLLAEPKHEPGLDDSGPKPFGEGLSPR